MKQHQDSTSVETTGPGLVEISREVAEIVAASGVRLGQATAYVQHTSASLVIQENADPTARRDLQAFLARLVPEGDPLYEHVAEGPDDMPAHVRSALTQTSITIPITGGKLGLGTWQGLYLWEHRRRPHRRKVLVHVLGE